MHSLMAFICDKCTLVSSRMEKFAALELYIQTLKSVNESACSVASLAECLDAFSEVNNSQTLALYPLQQVEVVMTL